MSDRKTKNLSGDSREALLEAAKHVFAEKGYDGATVKDLADEAGINISLVSYHFGGKEGLYRACIEGFGMSRVEATERILQAPDSKEDLRTRLKLFAEDFIDINIRERCICKIINRGIESQDPITMASFHSVFIRVFVALRQFLEAAQERGFIKKHLEIEMLSTLIFGALMHRIRVDDIAKTLGVSSLEDPVTRARTVEHWLELITDGIFAEALAPADQ